MPRIVFIVPSFPRLSETFIVNKFVGLRRQGWDVFVICSESSAEEMKSFEQLLNDYDLRRRIKIIWPHQSVPLTALLAPFSFVRCLLLNPRGTITYVVRGWERYGFDLLRRFYLDAELISLKPDLIHFEFGTLAVARTYLKAMLGCKLVVSFRGYDLNYMGLDSPDYYKTIWKQADAVHLLGQDLWNRAQRRGCQPDKQRFLIPPAIDADFFNPNGRAHTETVGDRGRPLRILSVGRLDWRKGYDYALQAVRLLIEQGIACEYRIVGEGEYLEAVAFARHQLGLEHSVELLEAQSPPEVKKQMLWADILLHASVSEGFCNAVLESQSMELPVVCTDAGGLPENVSDNETGFVVPRRDPAQLADRMLLLARDPELRARLGNAGRRRVLARFALETQIAEFGALYNQVLQADRIKDDVPTLLSTKSLEY